LNDERTRKDYGPRNFTAATMAVGPRLSKLLLIASCLLVMTSSAHSDANSAERPVRTGAEELAQTDFSELAGRRVGLVTNQSGLVNGQHLADLLHKAPNVSLVAIFAPEHGFRGAVEAGEPVRDGIDQKTGVPVHSLYGASKKPSQSMLANVDLLVFDIQDIGARFYTYISTMGLAMQAAAEAGIPFVVLDRPNPLGGTYVSGFVLQPKLQSFVGQYPIPIVHGLTVGELALMIKGERWLDGLESLDLRIVRMEGWSRAMRWPSTKLPWVATSPNIPTFMTALVYPGIGIVGETQLVNEGRGTAAPFTVFGAPWLDARRMAARLNALGLPGATFEATRYTPRAIAGAARNPRFRGKKIYGVRVIVTDVARYQPLEVGIHALSFLIKEARSKRISPLFANLRMFYLISGTKRLHRMLLAGASGSAIIAAWKEEVARFNELRAPYLLYR
jgi:uncharacterized protein YbbC (DUF1343 family)